MGADWHSQPARVARCLFCGNVGVWFQCRCPVAVQVQEKKLPFQMLVRGGKPVITKSCPEVLRAIRLAGVLAVTDETLVEQNAPKHGVETSPSSVSLAENLESESAVDAAESGLVAEKCLENEGCATKDRSPSQPVDDGAVWGDSLGGETEEERLRRLKRERQQRWRDKLRGS